VATLVFVNGGYVAEASSIARLPGLAVEPLGAALARFGSAAERWTNSLAGVSRNPFTILNTAFLAEGVCVFVSEGASIDRPIHLVFASGGGAPLMSHPRVLIVLAENSEATVVESYVSLPTYGGRALSDPAAEGGRVILEREVVSAAVRQVASDQPATFTNAVTEISAGPHSHLHHYRIQCEGPASLQTSGTYVRAASGAAVTCHTITLDGALVRNDIRAVLDGEGAECALNGLYVGEGSRVVDNHTTIEHAKPHGSSREVYKGILGDRARAIFNGKIVVRPDAQRTDAKQTSKALLLSEDAQINTNPQLEIFANDVKCTHGAAVGQIDDEAIFYLRARGLGEAEARQMLVRAFAAEVLNRIPLEPLRSRLDRELLARMPGARP
jgi:Fe-S cluster assembly protein SufD